MTSPSPSPTREEVDAELARVDDPYVCTDDRHRLLAAGVLALRAELDAARVASEQIAEWRTAELAELERLRADLGMEMGMRTAALDEIETLRRRLWSLLGDDQLSDDDTVDRLRAELARYRDAIRPRTDPGPARGVFRAVEFDDAGVRPRATPLDSDTATSPAGHQP